MELLTLLQAFERLNKRFPASRVLPWNVMEPSPEKVARYRTIRGANLHHLSPLVHRVFRQSVKLDLRDDPRRP